MAKRDAVVELARRKIVPTMTAILHRTDTAPAVVDDAPPGWDNATLLAMMEAGM